MVYTSSEFRRQASAFADELAQHPVLRRYWDRLSLVLKGSAARGNTDRYSDVDLVLFCDEDVRRRLITDYRAARLSDRSDGIFLPLADWAGHYHVESLGRLSGYFADRDYAQVWEFQHAIPLHDPDEQFARLLRDELRTFLSSPLPAIKTAYLDLQLALDWLRQPLRRGDPVAATLYGARLLRGCCQLAYLLDGQSYPHDKWLAYYLDTTRFGRANKALLASYVDRLPASRGIEPHLALDRYPAYAHGAVLIERVARFIRQHYGEQPWIEQWTAYV